MDYFVIEVPDMNDSVVKVSLQSRLYQLRFTWNDTGGYWMLGVMDSLGTPLLLGVKMVPQFPLNLLFGRDDMPSGIFAVLTEKESVGRQVLPMGRLVLCLSRHDAGTNHPVKSILILNKYLRAGLTIRSQKVPDKFPYTFTGKVRV